MKWINYTFLMIIGLLTNQAFAQYSKIELSSIPEAKKNEVHEFLNKAIVNCDKTETLKLTSKNATSRFKKFYKDGKLKTGCYWYSKRYGVVESVELMGAIQRKEYQVLRYKVKRKLAEWDSEIRIFLDDKAKLAGLGAKDYWSDTYYDRGDNPELKKIDTITIDQSILARNKSFALKSYQTCESSQMFVVNDENAIHRSLRNDWNGKLLIECDSIKRKNGALSNFRFMELYSDAVSTNVYRYKVQFDKLIKPSEIRVYSKLNDKYMGIFVIDVWYDKFYEFDKAKSRSLNDLGK